MVGLCGDTEMKRPAIIVAILIALVSLIGFERIRQGLRFLVFDDRAAGPRWRGQASGSEVSTIKTSGPEGSVSVDLASRSGHRSSADATIATSTDGRNDLNSVAVRIAGEVSPMHFIRASTIFGNSEPSKEQIDRLRKAVAVIGDALRPSAVIFDADGDSTSETPVIVFARDEFDLTTQVKEVYDSLGQTSHHPAQADSKAGSGSRD